MRDGPLPPAQLLEHFGDSPVGGCDTCPSRLAHLSGIRGELSAAEWRAVVRQLLAEGLLAVGGDYGRLALTDASAEVLGRRRTVMMHREPQSSASTRTGHAKAIAAAAELPAAAAPPSERLRTWRAATAKEENKLARYGEQILGVLADAG